jgi:hypothetical protein
MDEKTLEALKGSIAKWEAIVAGTGADNGSANCPLCAEFLYGNCFGCPVRERTKRSMCLGSPYHAFGEVADFHGHAGAKAIGPVAEAAARRELDFLKSLLPEASKQEVA